MNGKVEFSTTAKRLLEGSYDCHVHYGPDVVSRAQDVFDLARDAEEVGMVGVVMKDHTGSTVGPAVILNRMYPDGPRFFGSLTLNLPVGGLNPYAVERALRWGARSSSFQPTAHSIRSGRWAPAGFPKPFRDLARSS